MQETQKMNILVLGNSGAGKSTLIRAVAGVEVVSGVGEGSTQKISVYDSAAWPFRFIDTKGFEYSIVEQLRTIYQIKKYTREQLDDDDDDGIDAVWYCIEGTARRMFAHNIEMMNRAIKGWKNVPVFAVITKSYSRPDEADNIAAVREAFEKSKNVNLRGVFPVVAELYRIDDETSVEPRGLVELCSATLECSEQASRINAENRLRMVVEQKRFTAQAVTAAATTAAVAIGAVPISFADSALLVPLECGLTKGIFKVYGVTSSADLVTAVVGSMAITNIARGTISAITKAVPNIAGSVLNAVIAGFFVGALGEAVIALAEGIYSEKIDPAKIDAAVEFVANKLGDNAILAAVVGYVEKNSDKLMGKTAKEIFDSVKQALRSGRE